jgi:hypothetical protein
MYMGVGAAGMYMGVGQQECTWELGQQECRWLEEEVCWKVGSVVVA